MTTRFDISLSVARAVRILMIALALPIGLPNTTFLRSHLLTKGFVIPVAQAEEEGGGGGGGGGGEIAAQILFGLAAIIAAAAPVVAASIQAKADVSIAKTNANAQIQMTNTTSQTTLALAQQQAQIASNQSDTAKELATQNQQYSQEKLQMQLDALKQARTDQLNFDEEKQTFDQKIDQQRIQLAQQQSQQTLALNELQFKTQLSALGLSSGFSKTLDSGNTLSVNRGGTLGSNPAGPSVGPTTGGLGAGFSSLAKSTSGNGTQGPSFASNSGTVLSRLSSQGGTSRAIVPDSSTTQGNPGAAQRLLASALGPGSDGNHNELLMKGITGAGAQSLVSEGGGGKLSLPTIGGAFLPGGSGRAVGISTTIQVASPTLSNALKANLVVRGSTTRQHVHGANHSALSLAANKGPSTGLASFMHQTDLIHDQQSPEATPHAGSRTLASSGASAPVGTGSHGGGSLQIGANTYNPPSEAEGFSLRRALSPHGSSRPIAY